MKLYRCHAVMPRLSDEPLYGVRTYVVQASDWREARRNVRHEEPSAEFVTVPAEIPEVLMTTVWSISEAEFAALRMACDWNESQKRD